MMRDTKTTKLTYDYREPSITLQSRKYKTVFTVVRPSDSQSRYTGVLSITIEVTDQKNPFINWLGEHPLYEKDD